jgi:hypothetical protein
MSTKHKQQTTGTNAGRAERALCNMTNSALPTLSSIDKVAKRMTYKALERAGGKGASSMDYQGNANERAALPFSLEDAQAEARGAMLEVVSALQCVERDADGARAVYDTLAKYGKDGQPMTNVSPRAVYACGARALQRLHRKMSHRETDLADYVRTLQGEALQSAEDNRREFAMQGAYDKARAMTRRAFVYHGCMMRSLMTQPATKARSARIKAERSAHRRALRFIRRAFAYQRAQLMTNAQAERARIGFTLRIAHGVSKAGAGAKVAKQTQNAWTHMLRDYDTIRERIGAPRLHANALRA